MYAKLAIKIDAVTTCFRVSEYYGIYDFLTGHGYTHYEAEDVASWAQLACIGEEYELHGAEIAIEE